jgi:hypothetical protein
MAFIELAFRFVCRKGQGQVSIVCELTRSTINDVCLLQDPINSCTLLSSFWGVETFKGIHMPLSSFPVRESLCGLAGVLNTDNMSILGLTIDYGPYGFLDKFDPTWTPNLTDFQGRRYAFTYNLLFITP